MYICMIFIGRHKKSMGTDYGHARAPAGQSRSKRDIKSAGAPITSSTELYGDGNVVHSNPHLEYRIFARSLPSLIFA